MTWIITGVAGGLALFLLGLQLMSEGLRGAAGDALRGILQRVMANTALAFSLGGLVALLLQSSVVTTVLMVGFAGAGLVSFAQTLPVLLGANVGSTFTVQLAAFNLAEYSLLVLFAGFLVRNWGSRKTARHYGDALMGLGMLYFGMRVMTEAIAPIQEHAALAELLTRLGEAPLLTMVVGFLFTVVVRSAAASLGLVLSLAMQGIIGLPVAIPFVLGANVGTCMSAVLASLGAPVTAKRVAAAHVFFKGAGVLLFWPFIGVFESLATASTDSVSRQIANVHTFFNLALAGVFLPFHGYVARLIEWLLPESLEEPGLGTPMYLDREAIETAPTLALDQAERETFRVAGIVHNMVAGLAAIVQGRDRSLLEDALKKEEAVDRLVKVIATHLTELSERGLDRAYTQKVMRLFYLLSDLERVGDVVANIVHTQRKRMDKGLRFSEEGKQEILRIHAGVTELLKEAVEAFREDNAARARAVLRSLPYFSELERYSRLAHMGRLQAGIEVSRRSSGIHLHLVNDLLRIADHAASIAQTVLRPQPGFLAGGEDGSQGEPDAEAGPEPPEPEEPGEERREGEGEPQGATARIDERAVSC